MMSDWSTSQPIFSQRDVRQTTSRLALTLLDGCLILVAFAVAHWLRYDVRLGRDIYDPASYRQLSAFYPMMLEMQTTPFAVTSSETVTSPPLRADCYYPPIPVTSAIPAFPTLYSVSVNSA